MYQRTIWRLSELLVIFIGIPLAFYFEWLPIPKIAALLGVTAGCILILKFDPSYDLSNMFTWPGHGSSWKSILLKTATVAMGIFLLVMMFHADSLFFLPKEHPFSWAVTMLFYPVMSALPQELIYREFFFQRYGKIFGGDVQIILLNALSFSFLHIVYDNWWAAALSFAGGILFAQSYKKSRSLLWVSVEHAIYGCLIFTIGMGSYFYESL